MHCGLVSGLVLAATANAAMHVITVGKGGSLAFDPDSVTAAVGDTLQYHFYSGSGGHSVVSSTFQSPCVPNTDAFFSGYQAANTEGDITFEVNVTSTDPIWYYCSLARHCQNGMVGVVNPPSSGNTLDAYMSAAQSVSRASAPSSMTGGVLTTLAAGAAASTSASMSMSESMSMSSSMMMSASTTASMSMATSGSMMSTTSGGMMASSTKASTKASMTSTAATGSASTPATTTNDARSASDLSVVLGLSVVMGALAMLMA